ncbi:MAG TPA: HD domain-containing phosphohydrolase, partial [Atribacteraceae bacterium]|nr:HD domain-containing phosphohydrolase [Atribacteraceae bacterium]
AIVDAYDAMTNHRPYRETLRPDEALGELRRCAGTQFDPALVERFVGEVIGGDQCKNYSKGRCLT